MIVLKIFYGLVLIGLGVGLIKYRRMVKSWSWNFMWAERYIGNGWTYLVMIVVWLFLIFLWTIYPFWWLESLKWWWWKFTSQWWENSQSSGTSEVNE